MIAPAYCSENVQARVERKASQANSELKRPSRKSGETKAAGVRAERRQRESYTGETHGDWQRSAPVFRRALLIICIPENRLRGLEGRGLRAGTGLATLSTPNSQTGKPRNSGNGG